MDVLEVEGLSVTLGGRAVLRDVAFSLAPGMFCGLIGSNGSGKTTLLRAILGFQAAAGHIQRRGAVGYVPQKIQLDPDMPVRARDLVALGLDGNRLGLPWPSKKRRAAVAEALRAVEAEGFADQRIGELSGGQQQRVLIAHALVSKPDLLLLDEPLANLDLRAAAEIVALLRRLCTAQGVAVLLSAHDMNPLLGAVDRLVYLANGRAASGRVQEVVRTEVLSALYGYHIDVIRVHDRVLVVAAEGAAHVHHPEHVAAIP
jgi:zinc/manganese transport system ATP-binding protein